MNDKRLVITPEEAETLLLDGEYIHNFVNPGAGLMVGCDYDRADAIKAFKAAKQIEIGGNACKGMKHPIVVWDTDKHMSFFEADMEKVAAFEAKRVDAS